ncbi:MAG: isoprenylcysteine carboxylmethyltransferase family protein [Alphaproteobacteria bacterium]|nr:MAG: isoprenylcysteine carboxylmethyltransferase family protein [Alphaproteobacteria bacterium]
MNEAMNDMPDGEGGRDSAGVVAPPPLLYVGFFLMGMALEWAWPWPLVFADSMILGLVLALLGLGLVLFCAMLFRRAGTPLRPDLPTEALVERGLYRFSRNPIYVGLTVIYAGAALAAASWWPLAVLPLLLVVMNYGVIAREERYLAAKFGDAYHAYAKRVRRWF